MGKMVNTLLKLHLILAIIFGLHGRVLARYADAFLHKGESIEQTTKQIPFVGAKVIHCRLLCFTQDFEFVTTLPPAGFRIDLIPPSFVVHTCQVLYLTKRPGGHKLRLFPLRAPPFC